MSFSLCGWSFEWTLRTVDRFRGWSRKTIAAKPKSLTSPRVTLSSFNRLFAQSNQLVLAYQRPVSWTSRLLDVAERHYSLSLFARLPKLSVASLRLCHYRGPAFLPYRHRRAV